MMKYFLYLFLFINFYLLLIFLDISCLFIPYIPYFTLLMTVFFISGPEEAEEAAKMKQYAAHLK